MTTVESKPIERESFPKDDWYYKYYYDVKKILWNCSRCSCCKWIDSWEVKSARFAKVCPSNARYLFDAYSCQGRHDVILALLDGRLTYDSSPKLLDILYKCDTCGGCDASCKRNRDTEPLRMLLDIRAKFVEDGQLLPQHQPIIESLRREDNTLMMPKGRRGDWAAGIAVKDLTQESAEVAFHAGCQLSFNSDLAKVARTALGLLQETGADVGIFGKDESCCGCKAYDMGYRGIATQFAQSNLEAWANARVKTVVTPCSDCYWAFKRLYPQYGSSVEVLHIVEYLDRLIKAGELKFRNAVPLTVTYHDPCHLGRRDNLYVPGKAIMGVYDAPRDVLLAIPGVELTEMYRIKEYAWCCGAGGGVKEAYPDFSLWTAGERVEEALSTGAQALVSACPWCENNFREATSASGKKIAVRDVVELVRQAL